VLVLVLEWRPERAIRATSAFVPGDSGIPSVFSVHYIV
jgi:hypothetical protein